MYTYILQIWIWLTDAQWLLLVVIWYMCESFSILYAFMLSYVLSFKKGNNIKVLIVSSSLVKMYFSIFKIFLIEWDFL